MFGFKIPYLTPGLAIALLVALAGLAAQHQRVKRYEVEAQSARQTAQGLVTSVTSKDDLIAKLQAKNGELLSIARDQNEAIRTAGALIETYQLELRTQGAKLRELEESDRAKPECLSALSMDLARSCPALADGVRQRANRGLSGSRG